MQRLRRSPAAGIAPPGWYPHPERPEEEWYWDGTAWTESRWAAKPRYEARKRRTDRVLGRGKFRVAFDGYWQEEFDSLVEAVEWAQEVASTGRLTLVIEWVGIVRGHRFRAAFPEERAREGEEAWYYWRYRGMGGSMG